MEVKGLLLALLLQLPVYLLWRFSEAQNRSDADPLPPKQMPRLLTGAFVRLVLTPLSARVEPLRLNSWANASLSWVRMDLLKGNRPRELDEKVYALLATSKLDSDVAGAPA